MRILRVALLALAAWIAPALAEEGDALEIDLLTFAPGQVYWERFGHNALLVHDLTDDTSTIYNYGMFDFEEKNFFLNFVRGRMHYHLAALGLSETLWFYDTEGRGILAQRLNLTAGQRAALDKYLQWNVQPENATYDYDYFLANCSTKLRDALDRVLGGELKPQLEKVPTNATFRSEAVRLIWPDHALALAMDFGLGPLSDRPINLWERSYVPDALMDAVRHVRVNGGQPLVLDEQRLLPNHLPPPPSTLPKLAAPFLGIGLGVAIALMLLARATGPSGRVSFSALGTFASFALGFGGLVSLSIWAFTEHWAGARNPHVLQFDPLCLLLMPGWIMARRADWQQAPAHRWLSIAVALIGVGGLALSFFGPGASTRHWIWLALPMLIALAVAPMLRRSP
ncbi:MAG TPA: DUF4105 domain-containing protein [Nevskiaceae bacterium]|nr:DUF4105 domain-containing protein [Nevskiaceae bacterium]